MPLHPIEPTPRLLGYVDYWGRQAGQVLKIHASAPQDMQGTLQIERVICGDDSRGYRASVVAAIPTLAVSLENKKIHAGSCLVMDGVELAGNTLAFNLRVSRMQAATVVAIGGRPLLQTSENGDLRLGAQELQVLQSGAWLQVSLAFSADGGLVELRVRRGRRNWQVSAPYQATQGPLVLGAVLSDEGAVLTPLCGRIDALSITDASGKIICRPDVAGDPGSDWLGDMANPGRNFRLVNIPTRAVPGMNWDGSALSPRENAQHYQAIHFHCDDLEDAQLPVIAEICLPQDLPSGSYAAHIAAEGLSLRLPFFVTPAKACRPVVFLASTMTYHAYANNRIAIESPFYEISELQSLPVIDDIHLGLLQHPEVGGSHYDMHPDGHSIYLTTRRRPVLNMAPQTAIWSYNADTHITEFLEDHAPGFDVLTDDRLHEDGIAALDGAQVLLTGSHPEYVTDQVWDALAAFTARGGRIIYLGGNGFYWRVAVPTGRPWLMEVRRAETGARYNEPGPGEEFLQTNGQRSGLYRRLGRPPQSLVGVGMCADGWDSAAGYQLTEDAHSPRAAFVFEGVDGTVIGAPCDLHTGAAGQELDRADFALGTPRHALVLAQSGPHSADYVQAPEEVPFIHPGTAGDVSPQVRADMVFFETDGGGAVFSTGSIAWASTMQINGTLTDVGRVTRNVLRRFADPAPFAIPPEMD